jgi:tetratricopeptide (TPR) repeat protein
MLRLHREWRATDPQEAEAKRLSVALTLLALGEAAGVSELERGADEFETALYLYDFARYAEALQHYEKSLAIKLKQLGPEHPDVGACYFNMSLTQSSLGRIEEVLHLARKAHGIFLAALGPEHSHTVHAAALVSRLTGAM